MDDVYERAVKRADELATELKTLNDFIALYRRMRHLLGMDSTAHKENLISDTLPVDVMPHPADGNLDPPLKRTRVTDNPKPAAVVQAARRIIKEHGRPMSRRALHAALAAIGLEVNGSDPIKALGTMLWRAGDDLVQLKGLGYWLKDEDYEPAGYCTDPFFNTAEQDDDLTDASDEPEDIFEAIG